MSLSATAAKLLHQLNLTILACTSTGKEEKKKKAFQFYYLPAENWELRVERLRELHGRLKIYLRAEAVNISTAELQMTKDFLESRPPDPPRWKRAVGGKSGSILGVSLWKHRSDLHERGGRILQRCAERAWRVGCCPLRSQTLIIPG